MPAAADPTIVAKKILVVDDESKMADLWRRKFENEGYQVDVVHNGQEALDEMNIQKFDAILLDLFMPKVSGFEVLSAKAKTKNSQSPVYVVTGSLRDEDVEHAKELGAKEAFLKYRISPKDVVRAVKGE